MKNALMIIYCNDNILNIDGKNNGAS